jgi:nitrous oxide reductase
VGLKLNETHQLLAYVDDVNLLGDNIDTINKNTENLIDVSKDVGLEVNIQKTSICLCRVKRMQAKLLFSK